jgi:hypothetical protein
MGFQSDSAQLFKFSADAATLAMARSVTGRLLVDADEGGQLIRFALPGREGKTGRRILLYVPNFDSRRSELGMEFHSRPAA